MGHYYVDIDLQDNIKKKTKFLRKFLRWACINNITQNKFLEQKKFEKHFI